MTNHTTLHDEAQRCTTFTTQHGLTNPAEDTFYFAFICPNCEHTNPLKGSPHDFHDQSVRCLRCTWVAVLDGTALEQFAEGVDACE